MFDKFRGAVSGLVQQQKLNALSRENLDTYRDTVVRLYSDLVPDSRNAASLQGKQRAFSLSPTDVSRIHKEAIASFTKDSPTRPAPRTTRLHDHRLGFRFPHGRGLSLGSEPELGCASRLHYGYLLPVCQIGDPTFQRGGILVVDKAKSVGELCCIG
jgi:hypothetical protein